MPFKPGSQNDLMLRRLKRARGAWVSSLELERASGSHRPNSRASNLRKAGFKVDNRTERVGEKCHSFYRLED
jgi:hypothetical protein